MAPLPLLLFLLPIVYLWPVMDLPYALAKALHVVGMAVIAALVCRLEWGAWQRGLLLTGIFLAAAVMEAMQHVLPGRQGALVDVAYNAMGCAAGVVMYRAAARWKAQSFDDLSPGPQRP